MIVDATILSSRVEEWDGRQGRHACGTVYMARVGEVLKGNTGTVITFASNDEYLPKSRHLLFLYSSTDDFPTDVNIRLPEAEERDRQRCLKSLPGLKTDELRRVSFLRNSFIELGYLVIAPPELHPVAVSITEIEVNGKREPFPGVWKQRSEEADVLLRPHLDGVVLSWKELREWLVKRVNANAR
jgi:hypothetical protein